MNTKEQYIVLLRQFLDNHGDEYGVERMGIFGSVARNEQREGSDIDIIVDAPDLIDMFKIIEMKERLEKIFGMPVDVVRNSENLGNRFKIRLEKEAIYV
jgi:predicted nucleotidyltransferase